jgi:pimeloyl-ACP methyl ester carboxylesterase
MTHSWHWHPGPPTRTSSSSSSGDSRRRRPVGRFARLAALIAAAIALVVTLTPAASSGQPAQPSPAPKPTIVLVHGAFADGSSWNDVIKRLQGDGYTVVAPADPLRDVAGDSAYVQSVLATIDGPVVLVGHSYGGAVISNAGNAPNVRALVYVAGFALDSGESLASINAQFPNNQLGPAVVARPFPQPDGTMGTDLYVNPEQFRAVFAADVPAKQTDLMAATQRPLSLAAVLGPSGTPAWRTVPTWYLVARKDLTIDPAAERFMAQRAGATTVEITSSHVAMISHPGKVTDLIEAAATATATP